MSLPAGTHPVPALTTGSARRLDQLARANLFLVPLDTRREWYRYHHLFGEMLARELARAEPSLVADLHRRAALWLLDAGEVTSAIHHLLAAGEHAEAAEVVARRWSSFMQLNLESTVSAWLDALPGDVVAADARLCIAAAIIAISLNRPVESRRWIDAAEHAEPAGPFHDGFTSAAAGAATARTTVSISVGDLSATLEHARRAAALEPPTSPWRGVAVAAHGVALRWLGRESEAERSLAAAVRVARASGQMAVSAVYALGHLAGLAADRLNWSRASERADEALRTADEHGIGEHLVCGIAHLVRGRVAEQAGEYASALPTCCVASSWRQPARPGVGRSGARPGPARPR